MPRRILLPAQRIFDPVMYNGEVIPPHLRMLAPAGSPGSPEWSLRAVPDTIFSDFPTIESALALDEISIHYVTHRLNLRRELPAVIFCHHPIRRRRRGAARQLQSHQEAVTY